jgi:hypothetical protein
MTMALRILLICAAAGIAIVNAAYAQDTPPPAPVESNPAAPPRNEESSVSLTAPEPRKLVGTPVQTASGEKLGAVEDVMKDEVHGREFVILKIGADKFVTMPLSAVNLMMRDKVLVLERSRLEGAPNLGADWRRHVSNDAYRQSESYWRTQPETQRSASPKPDAESTPPERR